MWVCFVINHLAAAQLGYHTPMEALTRLLTFPNYFPFKNFIGLTCSLRVDISIQKTHTTIIYLITSKALALVLGSWLPSDPC